MSDNTNIIMSASDLMLTFLANVSDYDVKYVGGLNPFTIKVDGEDVYIYIKNLSPAQLSNGNPDVWRIQLPMRDGFEKIKESDRLFLLFGYDAENKVYTTWNPYWCKQRLNIGKSVSLYSRLSLHQRVQEQGQIEQMQLNNDGDVVCIPEKKLYDYIKGFKAYYPEDTLFVPKGSSIVKRQKTAVMMLYDFITDKENLPKLKEYLIAQGRSTSTANGYQNYVQWVHKNNLFEKYKSLFADSTENPKEVLQAFIHTPEIKEQDVAWHGAVRAALNRFYDYYLTVADKQKNEEPEVSTPEINEPMFELDEFGKLMSIDDEIRMKLYPLAQEEYPDYEEMIRLAGEYYPSEIMDKMTPVDWINLFDNTKWKKPRAKKEKEESNGKPRTRRSNKSIKITTPEGDVIQESSATETYLYIFEHNYPDLIVEIDFGDYVISRERMPDYPNTVRHQSQLSNGYFVSTNFDTDTKAKILKRISDELGLGLKIDVVLS